MDYYLWLIDSATCHEIAHQWFYGIVGNDQIAAAWLDEGACRFAEYLYQKTYCTDLDFDGYGTLEDWFQTQYCMITGQEKDGQQYAEDKTDLDWSLYDWQEKDPMGYSDVYYKGGSLFYEMSSGGRRKIPAGTAGVCAHVRLWDGGHGAVPAVLAGEGGLFQAVCTVLEMMKEALCVGTALLLGYNVVI